MRQLAKQILICEKTGTCARSICLSDAVTYSISNSIKKRTHRNLFFQKHSNSIRTQNTFANGIQHNLVSTTLIYLDLKSIHQKRLQPTIDIWHPPLFSRITMVKRHFHSLSFSFVFRECSFLAHTTIRSLYLLVGQHLTQTVCISKQNSGV